MALDATGSSGAAQGAAGNNYLSSAEEFKRVCPFAVAAEILELCKVLAEILALPTGFLGDICILPLQGEEGVFPFPVFSTKLLVA